MHQLIFIPAHNWGIRFRRADNNRLELLPGEDVYPDKMDFAVSMLARLRCTQINQLAWLALYHHVAAFSQVGIVHGDCLALAIECSGKLGLDA
jgi:hypothetical protein